MTTISESITFISIWLRCQKRISLSALRWSTLWFTFEIIAVNQHEIDLWSVLWVHTHSFAVNWASGVQSHICYHAAAFYRRYYRWVVVVRSVASWTLKSLSICLAKEHGFTFDWMSCVYERFWCEYDCMGKISSMRYFSVRLSIPNWQTTWLSSDYINVLHVYLMMDTRKYEYSWRTKSLLWSHE